MKPLHLLLLLLFALPTAAQRHAVRRDGHVLAHSLRFDPRRVTSDMPQGLQEMLRAYQTQQRYAPRTPGRAVTPLLNSVRHQEDPFNRSCPYYIDDQGTPSSERCLVGCVATCIEQVLSYYRRPAVLADTLHGWATPHYRVPDVMPGTPIDWDNILPDYRAGYTEAQARAVSDLSLYCGMAAHMNWGTDASSASLYRAFEPLCRAFGYETVVFLPRALYATPRWNALLRNELEHGRPICYTGHNLELSGHAFNIDGVDEQGYYHLNWGYGGEYDGYFDLDYLNPFEPLGDPTDLGQQSGFFSNQTALFLHPDDLPIDFADTLTAEQAFAGVRVDTIAFRRQPDLHGYVVADFSMTNTTADSLNFTFEVLTYLPTDTAVFAQADYVALSAVNLAPGQQCTWPVYCRFTQAGDRILAFSADDETLPYKTPIHIGQGTAPQLTFGELSYQLYAYDANLVAEFSLDIANQAPSGYAGNLLTYCLCPADGSPDSRHWQVLSLAGGSVQHSVVRFSHLQDGQTYTLLLRCPWTVQRELTFTVRSDEATDAVIPVPVSSAAPSGRAYDLSGRPLRRPKGLTIRQGKKIYIP